MQKQEIEHCTLNELENLQTAFKWAQKSINNKTNKNTHDTNGGREIDNKSSNYTIEFNGTRYEDVTVRPFDSYTGNARYIIDKNGNGLLFALCGSRVDGCCVPIKNNKILTTYIYKTTTEIHNHERSIANLLGNQNQELLRKVITCFEGLLKEDLPYLPVTDPHPAETNEYNLPNGLKVKRKQEYTRRGEPLQTSLTFTDRYGNGKCIYTDGYIIPVHNGKLMEYLGYPYPNGTNVFKEIDKLVHETVGYNQQQSQQAYPYLVYQWNQINTYQGRPKPQRRFGRHNIHSINNFTFSVSRDISTQKIVSIMITDKNGNGQCFYSDGYVNPVYNRQTFATFGTKQSLDAFNSLTNAIETHDSYKLSNFCRTTLSPNNNILPIIHGQHYNQNIQQHNQRQFFPSINMQNNMQPNVLLQQYNQNLPWKPQNRNLHQQQYNNHLPKINNFIGSNLYNVNKNQNYGLYQQYNHI